MLPAATEAVWRAVGAQTSLGGFVLVGGTALCLRIHHRVSEDLDLVWLQGRLPGTRIDTALSSIREAGFDAKSMTDPAAVADFVAAGLDLADHQRDFSIDGVKISFFVADAFLSSVIDRTPSTTPRIATVQEIFASKCLVSAKRSRTRDWIDLYVLFKEHGFTMKDYVAVFERAGDPLNADIGLARLCSGKPDLADEGFAHLLASPPSVPEMRDFFARSRDELEIENARQAFEGHKKDG